ncbi:MAG: hypothetical protein U0174_03445 [Polyangiaceae bacterium]
MQSSTILRTVLISVVLLASACGSTTSTGTSSSGSGEGDSGASGDAGVLADGASSDGAVRRQPDGAVCSKQVVTVPDSAASSNPSGGPSGCSEDKDCAVRYQGDYCNCASEPRPITSGSAIAFDEGLNGISLGCTCSVPPICEKPNATAYCNKGVCALR